MHLRQPGRGGGHSLKGKKSKSPPNRNPRINPLSLTETRNKGLPRFPKLLTLRSLKFSYIYDTLLVFHYILFSFISFRFISKPSKKGFGWVHSLDAVITICLICVGTHMCCTWDIFKFLFLKPRHSSLFLNKLF